MYIQLKLRDGQLVLQEVQKEQVEKLGAFEGYTRSLADCSIYFNHKSRVSTEACKSGFDNRSTICVWRGGIRLHEQGTPPRVLQLYQKGARIRQYR